MRRALIAIRFFTRVSIEYPTMRLDQTSLTAHRYSLPSLVRCSVMSVNHNRLGPSAWNWRCTRSSWTAGPGFFHDPFLTEWNERIRCSLQIRWTRFSPAVMPISGRSSAMRR